MRGSEKPKNYIYKNKKKKLNKLGYIYPLYAKMFTKGPLTRVVCDLLLRHASVHGAVGVMPIQTLDLCCTVKIGPSPSTFGGRIPIV